MGKDIELTSYLLHYLHDSGYFKSKREIVETFDMTKRLLQRLMNTPEKSKAGSIALGKVLCYFGNHHIPLEKVLEDFLDSSTEATSVIRNTAAYQRLALPQSEPLHKEKADNLAYYQQFLQLLSQYLCPSCSMWCEPWNEQTNILSQNCLIGDVARRIMEEYRSTQGLKDVIP